MEYLLAGLAGWVGTGWPSPIGWSAKRPPEMDSPIRFDWRWTLPDPPPWDLVLRAVGAAAGAGALAIIGPEVAPGPGPFIIITFGFLGGSGAASLVRSILAMTAAGGTPPVQP